MKKRILAIAMCAAAVFSMAACSQSDSTESAAAEPSAVASESAAASEQPAETRVVQDNYQSTGDAKLDYPDDWSIEISGAEKTELKLADIQDLAIGSFSQARDLEAAANGENTSEKTEGVGNLIEYKGYMIGDVLGALGVDDYKSVTLTGADGTSKTLEKELLDSIPTYYLALEMDNVLLDDEYGPVMLVEPGVSPEDSVKNITKIEINK